MLTVFVLSGLMNQVDNKRIAKNTLYMYLRMLVTMFVSLFTARINFQALGIGNFGIYNVVGSVIVFFIFLNQGLTTATRRYITAEIAQGDDESQRNVFNLAIWAHVFIAAVIFVLGETIGLWAVNNVLNLPENRMFAANVVYQLSVISTLLQIMQVPFTAAITAHERMNIYAYLSILDVIMKLLLAYIVMIAPFDKLIVFAVCIFFVGALNIFANRLYCYHKFPMCRYQRPRNKSLLKEMFGYMGWNLAEQGMLVLTYHGITVLVNLFFNVAANAAMGVSNQITRIVNSFVTNFQVAFHPQITKQYVTNNHDELNQLALKSSRYSSYLVLLFFVPICCQIKTFLEIWLGNYPEFTVEFCVLTLIGIYVNSIGAPLWMILSSDKNIKVYKITVSIIYSFNFIGAWILLELGFSPFSVIIVRIIVFLIANLSYLILIKGRVSSFPTKQWLFDMVHSALLTIIPFLFYLCVDCIDYPNSLMELFVVGSSVFFVMGLSIFLLGLKKTERFFILSKIHIIRI